LQPLKRSRLVRPEFFQHELLQELEIRYPEQHPMLVFAGLWGMTDKLGTFLWTSARIMKLRILPFLNFDISRTLDILAGVGLIFDYYVDGVHYGFIPGWKRQQTISGKEKDAPPIFPEPSQELLRDMLVKFPRMVGEEPENALMEVSTTYKGNGLGSVGEVSGSVGEDTEKLPGRQILVLDTLVTTDVEVSSLHPSLHGKTPVTSREVSEAKIIPVPTTAQQEIEQNNVLPNIEQGRARVEMAKNFIVETLKLEPSPGLTAAVVEAIRARAKADRMSFDLAYLELVPIALTHARDALLAGGDPSWVDWFRSVTPHQAAPAPEGWKRAGAT
jgi:hypothetical protein